MHLPFVSDLISATAPAVAAATSATSATVAGLPHTLFPFAEVWWIYGVFLALVIGVIALDLGIFHRKAHVIGFREAATWSTIWVTLALVVNGVFWWWAHGFAAAKGLASSMADGAALEFFTGYLIEFALSVDNLFVIALILGAFAVPKEYQHRVLFWGIIGALLFRSIFIAMGAAIMQYHWVILVAGIFLIVTGIKMALMGESKPDPQRNLLVRLVRRFFPVTPTIAGQSFFVRHAGVLMVTPLFLALCAVELTDIIFALDSVPAIFAISDEALIVFMSNILAIMGLRSLYFLLAGVMDSFHLLKYALAGILIFVGLKMAWLNDLAGGKFPIGISLAIIAAMLLAGVVGSLMFPHQPKADKPA